MNSLQPAATSNSGIQLCNAKTAAETSSGRIVLLASSMGFCFGVRDALSLALADPNPQGVTIHGELVHNEEVLSRLRDLGYEIGPGAESDELPGTGRVMITAHGISDSERARLAAAGKQLIDTTCPLVRRVHDQARELARAGYLLLVIGKPGHVEVLGITGDLEDYRVLSNPEDVETYARSHLGVICQTTFQQSEARLILARVRNCNPKAQIRFVDSTCEPTRQRIAAVQALIAEVDVLIVVGGKNSNNSMQQVRMAERAGMPVYLVQVPADLRQDWFADRFRVGLSAGTSTMDESIDAVHAALLALA